MEATKLKLQQSCKHENVESHPIKGSVCSIRTSCITCDKTIRIGHKNKLARLKELKIKKV